MTDATQQRKAWAFGTAVVAAVSALGPWATLNIGFGTISVAGTDGDGILTLILFGIAALLLGLTAWGNRSAKVAYRTTAVLALLAVITQIYNWNNIAGEGFSAGWGLVVGTVTGVLLVGMAVLGLRDGAPDTDTDETGPVVGG